ncbi:hypothetical protein GJ744_000101 [Endocarpon pusillum]|uniref:Uncharacterized protein n=1 Tax=Endocarpon pusillum TaxID=364733 RepID=A0A8H7EC20_9EURO|nr:hypothetical protein GJ744_000101 [Endocarpon pusillum]
MKLKNQRHLDTASVSGSCYWYFTIHSFCNEYLQQGHFRKDYFKSNNVPAYLPKRTGTLALDGFPLLSHSYIPSLRDVTFALFHRSSAYKSR